MSGTGPNGKLLALLVVVTLLGVFFRIYGIASQPPLMDEVQVAFSAENYMERGHFGPTMPYHPNLRNVLVYGSMKALGGGVPGLRGFSLLFGVLSIPLLGLLIYRVTGSVTASALGAFFLAADPVHITFSRQAIQEVHTAFFFILGTLLSVLAAGGIRRQSVEKASFIRPELLVVLAGVSFGFGLASKAHALFPLVVCAAYLIYVGLKERDPGFSAFSIFALSVLPLTVYMLTYYPWFMRGYGLSDWFFMQGALLQRMASHMGNPMDSMIDTEPWKWFIRPLMGYGNFTFHEGRAHVTIAMGNPLMWLPVIPSALYLIYRRPKGSWLMLILFLAAYLPLALSPRPIWLLSSIAVTPFAYGIVGTAIASLKERAGRKALYAYVILVLAVSSLMYPMSVGRAWEHSYLRPLIMRLDPHTNPLLRGELMEEGRSPASHSSGEPNRQ